MLIILWLRAFQYLYLLLEFVQLGFVEQLFFLFSHQLTLQIYNFILIFRSDGLELQDLPVHNSYLLLKSCHYFSIDIHLKITVLLVWLGSEGGNFEPMAFFYQLFVLLI